MLYNVAMNAKDFTLDEKLRLLCGKEHSMNLETFNGKLPLFTMSDGPHGLRTFRKDENGKSKARDCGTTRVRGSISRLSRC